MRRERKEVLVFIDERMADLLIRFKWARLSKMNRARVKREKGGPQQATEDKT